MDDPKNELLTLKVIAETLNRSDDMRSMLQLVLEKLIEVTGLKVGWLFLAEDRPNYQFVADVNLPPALSRDNKAPMCRGVCYCLSNYWAGELNQAVNIINCKRLGDAIRHNTGDTEGITHHATVPLSAGGEMFGVLNVASPNKQEFTEDELNLLQSVAYQIGTAIKRMKLYEEQKRRAKTLAKLDIVTRSIWEVEDVDVFPCRMVESVGQAFGFSRVLFLLDQGGRFTIASDYRNGTVSCDLNQDPEEWVAKKRSGRQKGIFPFDAEPVDYFWLPILTGAKRIGGLAIKYDETFAEIHQNVFLNLADHIALGWENMQLNERRRELNLIEERNRLALDLHDAVSQKLFSLSLTSKGAIAIANKNPEALKEALGDIQKLSQEALTEMRAMIFQLRPIPRDHLLSKEIESYARGLGIRLSVSSRGESFIPEKYRENLWRVLQESINNISKHAGVKEASVSFTANDERIVVKVVDGGNGFDIDSKTTGKTLGLTSIRERVEAMDGLLSIESKTGVGTTITIHIPLRRR
ncbi:MAG: GAF domain-containing sensor histidine kinase [Tuberibacillus sp.]